MVKVHLCYGYKARDIVNKTSHKIRGHLKARYFVTITFMFQFITAYLFPHTHKICLLVIYPKNKKILHDTPILYR